MPLQFHPKCGTILICDFSGFQQPEMVKRRPVIAISPIIDNRPGLCTVVALSTTEPSLIKPYHYKMFIDPVLPRPYDSPFQWVKGDMIYSLSFQRLTLPFTKKDGKGKRVYEKRVISKEDLKIVQNCVLHGLGLPIQK